MMFGCSPATVTPSIQASLTDAIATATTPPIPSATVTASATVEPDFPEGCINLEPVMHFWDGKLDECRENRIQVM